MFERFSIAALVTLACGVLNAQAPPTAADLAKLGPQVGARVPDFSLSDQNGQTRTLQSVLGREGAMLVFFRSAEW